MSDAIKFVLFYQGSLRNFSKVETLVIVLKNKLYKSRNLLAISKKPPWGSEIILYCHDRSAILDSIREIP